VKASRRVVLYLVLGVACFAAWVPLHVIRTVRNPSITTLSGVVLTLAIALVLLASITRLEAKVKSIEDYLRLETSRERSRAHDKDTPEPEPPADANGPRPG